MTQSSRKHRSCVLAWLVGFGLFLIALSGKSALAQTATNANNNESTPAPNVGHDYVHSLSEIVDPGNGSLSVRITVPVPQSRGFTIPFSIAYGSNGIQHLQPSNPPGTVTWWPDNAYLSQQGWSYTTPLLSFYETYNSEKWKVENGVQFYSTCFYLGNFVFTDPSGGRHSLYLAFLLPNQTQFCTDALPNASSVLSDTQVEGGYQAYIAPSGTAPNPTIYVVSPDGTVYTFKTATVTAQESSTGSPEIPPTPLYSTPTIEDRNGNITTIGATGQATNSYDGVPIWVPMGYTDSAKRTSISTSGFGASGNTITTSTMSGPYTVDWGSNTFSDSPSYTLSSKKIDTQSACPSSIGGGENSPAGDGFQPISTIKLPNGQEYQFLYDSTSGRLGKIIYPTGGWVQYVWGPSRLSDLASFPDAQVNPVSGPYCEDQYDTVAVIERIVSFDGTHTALQQNFSYSTTWNANNLTWATKQTIVTTEDYVQGITYQTTYNYTPQSLSAPPNNTSSFGNQVPIESSIVYKGTSGTPLRTVYKTWSTNGLFELASQCTQLDNNLNSGVFYTYNTAGQVTDKKEYDYGTVSSGGCALPSAGPTRETVTQYQSFAITPIYANAASILDRPSSVVIENSSGTSIAETDYAYDGASVTAAAGVEHDETNYGPSSTAPRGNATTVTRKCLGCTNTVTSYTYDENGQIHTEKDPNGNTTTYSYADSYASGTGTPPGSTYAYLTQITYPSTSVAHILNFSYGYDDGQLRSSTDENDQITSYQYNDPLDRLTETQYPASSNETPGETIISYNDEPLTPSVTTERLISSGQYLTTVDVMDGMGHVTDSQLTSDPVATDHTVKVYDGVGSVHSVTNPYRTTSDPTYGVTTYTYDPLGRTIEVQNPDNSEVQTSYTGRATEVTDEGNGTQDLKRVTQTDAFGRLTSVCEVSATTQQGTTPSPAACSQDIAATGFLTSYSYDPLNNLLQVTQGGLTTRTFTYNSLSKLITATNPESGLTSYTYDGNGNVITRTQPEENQTSPSETVTTTYTYDALNRLTAKAYSDDTDNVDFNYDETSPWGTTLTNTVGRLTTEYDGNTGSDFSYDAMGRVIENDQCTPQNCGSADFPLAYTYDAIGDITSSTDGQYNLFIDTYDNAAHLTKLVSSYSDSNHPPTLFSAPTGDYNAPGMLVAAQLGNGIAETVGYNDRLEMTSRAAGSVYSVTMGYAPDGDVTSATDSANGKWAYTYDDLNRLNGSSCSASCPDAGSTQGFSYSYDRFGNRWTQTVTAGTGGTFSLSFTGNNNHIDGYSYDAAGNLLSDGQHTYYYDAEHHLVQVDGSAGWCQSNTGTEATACYTYDGQGRRTRRAVPGSGITDDYLYDLNGHYITQVSSTGWWIRGEIYAGGRHLATYENDLSTPTTFFEQTDWLGTERVQTAVNGTACETITSLAFGDGLSTSGSCDPSALYFTGKERDWESNLDNFEARYYSSQWGRFMIADWSAVPEPVPYAALTNPQSLNLYTYVQNSPVTHVDLDGHAEASSTESGAGANASCGMDADAGADSQEAACIQSVISYWTDTKQQNDANADAGLAEQNGSTPPPADTESKDPDSSQNTSGSAQQQNTDQSQQNQNNNQNQQNNQDQNQQNQPIQMSGGKGGGQGKGERRQTSKPDNPTKGARPVRDPSGKITGWRVPTADGKGKVKTLEWGKANGLDPANFRKVGIGAAIVTGAAIVGRAIAGCFESGVCEAIP